MQACPVAAAVLISGGGTNLQAFIDAIAAGTLDLELSLVISNRHDAFGLTRAARAGVATCTIPSRDFSEREEFDAALTDAIRASGAELILLAGFMRILGRDFVTQHAGRVLNIHPSLLPKYQGLDTHARALAAGDREHGSTVHFVTEELDGGPRIVQGRVPVLPDDDPALLASRVLEIEHRIYPYAASLYAARRLECRDGTCWLDGAPLPEPLQYE